MKIEVKRSEELSHKRWSGGTTTQLAIWPEGADYAARRFKWRISTAVVEEEKSVFTSLPGVYRHLMILDGSIALKHEGIRQREMKPLCDVEEFDGGWNTSSVGKCVDFNLMTKDGWCGAMAPAKTGEDVSIIFMPDASEYWRGIYSLCCGLSVKIQTVSESRELLLDRGDFLLFSFSPRNEGEARISLASLNVAAPAVYASVWTGKKTA